ncbi:MAG: hypothetical protein AB8B85_16330 [Paracoccaceae bacterium]
MQFEGADFDAKQVLARQPGIETLTLYNIRKKDMGRIQGLAELPLKHLEIRWLSAPDLTDVPLPGTLDTFMLWHSRTKSLAGVERARNLTGLNLSENSTLEDMTALAALPGLRRLSIVGGFNGGQKITTFEPLRGLQITELELAAIDGAQLDLGPVATLPLETVDIWGRSFAPAELAKVCRAFPVYYQDLLRLKDYSLDGMRCPKCDGRRKEMFLRGKNFLWCPDCQHRGLAKVLADFDALVQDIGS